MSILSNIKGVKDIFDNEILLFRKIERLFNEISEKYGYSEMRTAILEYTELFSRGIGEFTDIVEKEMFTLTDSKGKKISLRPENTAGVVRSFIQNGLFNLPGIKKYFYIGPMFRHERPQAGRLRQFHQIGCEAFGADSPIIDVECIQYACELISGLGIKKYDLQISSVGCPVCRKEYNSRLVSYLYSYKQGLCSNCNQRMEKNPLRVLDCKEGNCQDIIAGAPKIVDSLCQECSDNFNEILGILKNSGVNFSVNKRLVRGLDYYTKTVFEIVCEGLGSQNTVLAGGRYNNLVKQLGGPEIPAVGWASGIERLVMILSSNGYHNTEGINQKNVFLVYDESVKHEINELLTKFRKNNIRVLIDYECKSFKSQFRLANKLGCEYVLIFGGNEMKSGIIKLKNFSNGTETEILITELIEKIKPLIFYSK
ncbi:histidine--tRNA ligase [Candidatus Dependentiae bacterium]|nr:histidine--tRNA ligase [Candidatus Dependentiae bacterium]